MGFENGKLVRVTLQATKGGHSQVNTFHYDLDDGSIGESPNDPQALADRFRDDVIPLWKTWYASSWTIQPVVVVEEKDPLHPLDARQEWTSGAPIAGTATIGDDKLPSGMCTLVKLLTANIGRRHRGRLFLGGDITEAQQANGVWETNHMTARTTLMNAIPMEPDIVSGASLATAKWCVYSRTARAQDSDPYASAITAYSIHTQTYFLRTRQFQ